MDYGDRARTLGVDIANTATQAQTNQQMAANQERAAITARETQFRQRLEAMRNSVAPNPIPGMLEQVRAGVWRGKGNVEIQGVDPIIVEAGGTMGADYRLAAATETGQTSLTVALRFGVNLNHEWGLIDIHDSDHTDIWGAIEYGVTDNFRVAIFPHITTGPRNRAEDLSLFTDPRVDVMSGEHVFRDGRLYFPGVGFDSNILERVIDVGLVGSSRQRLMKPPNFK